jgi:hypothetical protein
MLVLIRGALMAEVEVNSAKYSSIRNAATQVVAQARVQRDGGEISDHEYARQIVVQYLALAGKGLMLWDEVSWSSTSHALLVGIVLFLVLGLVGLGLTAWFLVMPGQVALRPGDPSITGLFCGAARVVLVARITAVVFGGLFFLLLANQFAASCTVCFRRRPTAEFIVKLSRGLDNISGVPVAGPLMHAFLVRSSVDRVSLTAADLEIQAALLSAEQAQIDCERAALCSEVDSTEQLICGCREQLMAAVDPALVVKLSQAQDALESKSKDMMQAVHRVAEPVDKAHTFTDERIDDLSEVATGLKKFTEVKFVADLIAASKNKKR